MRWIIGIPFKISANVRFYIFLFFFFIVIRGKLARIDFGYLQTQRKQEDRTVGNLLVSVSFILFV